MEDQTRQQILRLKLVTLERNKIKEALLKAKESKAYIFTPENDLEEAAIAVAVEGPAGWKDSLYSLNYFDRYLEHTCFIFATQPPENQEQEWLLVNFDGRTGTKYWIALGEKVLSEVYYAWAKVVQKPDPQFDLERMKNVSSTTVIITPENGGEVPAIAPPTDETDRYPYPYRRV